MSLTQITGNVSWKRRCSTCIHTKNRAHTRCARPRRRRSLSSPCYPFTFSQNTNQNRVRIYLRNFVDLHFRLRIPEQPRGHVIINIATLTQRVRLSLDTRVRLTLEGGIFPFRRNCNQRGTSEALLRDPGRCAEPR